MARPIATALFIIFLFTSSAFAQVPPKDVVYESAVISWTFDGTAGGFTVKCGITTGAYTYVATLPDPNARQMAVKQVVPGPGIYFCTVAAFNRFGQGPDLIPEVHFNAGGPPPAPTNGAVTVK